MPLTATSAVAGFKGALLAGTELEFRLALRAIVPVLPVCCSEIELKDRLMSPLVTGSTKAMRGLAFCGLRLQLVSERSATIVGQFVSLLLSVPCFKLSHLLFKIAYSLNQRRLLRLFGKDFFLKLYDRGVANRNVVEILQSLRTIQKGLKDAEASDEFGGHCELSPWLFQAALDHS
jgi:hypothetical protein